MASVTAISSLLLETNTSYGIFAQSSYVDFRLNFAFCLLCIFQEWCLKLNADKTGIIDSTTCFDNYMRAFADGPRNFEPWSSDVVTPELAPQPMGVHFSSRQI
ncbi:hypothetical protein TNCV_884771 [Trichonephila clavipes]|nr:hypothetical protein TNCV_884771 [Trichonephila clavipes]